MKNNMKTATKYEIQQEFDNESTYIVDTTLSDGAVLCELMPYLSPALRRKFAKLIVKELKFRDLLKGKKKWKGKPKYRR